MPSRTTWIVLANGTLARVIANYGPGQGLEELESKTLHAEPPLEYADQPDQVYSRTGPGRAKIERRSPKKLAEAEFARLISDRLTEGFNKGEFNRLILAAGPHMLGLLRDRLDHRVQETVITEIGKDLTKVTVHDVPPHLEDILRI